MSDKSILLTLWVEIYHKTYNIRCSQSQNLNVSHLLLQFSLPNPLKPDIKSRMKMYLEQHPQVMLHLHLSYQQLYCLLRRNLYNRFDCKLNIQSYHDANFVVTSSTAGCHMMTTCNAINDDKVGIMVTDFIAGASKAGSFSAHLGPVLQTSYILFISSLIINSARK